MSKYRMINDKKKLFELAELILFAVIVFVINIIYVGKFNTFYVLNDEFGYWASAAKFAGYDWSSAASTVNYYSYGYSLLLFPLFAVFKDPAMLYKAALVMNAAMMSYNSQGAVNGAIVDPTCGYTEHMHGTNCACDIEAHKHTAECYRDILHTHVETCYNYSCGEIDHTHTDGCNRLICGIIENHTHTSNCTKSNQKNTVKTVYRKYEESLDDIWPITDDNGITYDGGERWKPSNSSYFSQVMVYAATMNPENFTLTLDEASYTPYTMNYWLQVLPGEAYTTSYNGRNYVLAHTIKASYNYVTKAEDFFDIAGFDQAESDPTFSNNQISISGNDKTVDFYYARKTDHYLRFNNNGTVLDDKSVYGIMYGAPLAHIRRIGRLLWPLE